jgi:hypothetical protein
MGDGQTDGRNNDFSRANFYFPHMVPIQKSWDGHKFLGLQFRPNKHISSFGLCLDIRFTQSVYSVDEKSSNSHKFPLTEPNWAFWKAGLDEILLETKLEALIHQELVMELIVHIQEQELQGV